MLSKKADMAVYDVLAGAKYKDTKGVGEEWVVRGEMVLGVFIDGQLRCSVVPMDSKLRRERTVSMIEFMQTRIGQESA